MKRMNNKGFSLVEVLAVIIIISALSTLIVPNIVSYMEQSKDEYVYNLKNNMILMAKNFYSDNRNRLLEKNTGLSKSKTMSKDYVTIAEMRISNYATGEIKDSEGKDCTINSYVVAVNEGLGYNYYACLICGEKNYFNGEEEKYCDLN